VRGRGAPDPHPEAGARAARLLQEARPRPAARLDGPQLPRHVRQPRERQGGDALPGLRPRRRLHREVCGQGDCGSGPLRGRGQGGRPLGPDAGGAARLRAVDGLQGRQGRPRSGGLPQVLLPGRELRPVPAFGADPPPVDQEVHLPEPEIRGQRDDPEVAALGGHAGEVLPERLDQAGPGHGLGGHEESLPARGDGVGHPRGHGARRGEGRAVRRCGRPGAETRRGAARELWLPEEVALRRRLPGAVLGVLWILPALVLITSLILYPVAYAIWLSLFDKHSFFPAERWVGLGNYARIAGDAEFWDSLWKGVVYAGASTGLQLVLGLAAALVLHQAFRGRTAIRALVLFPYMIPTIVAVIVWRWLLNETYGVVVDGLLGLLLVPAPLELDVHEVRHRVALGRGRRGGARDPDAADLRVHADLHLLPGRLRRRARGDHVPHAHGGDARLLPALLGRGGRGVRRLAWRAFVYAAALGLAAQAVVPLLWMLSTSLKPPREVFATPPTFVPAAPTLENFVRLVTDTAFLTYFRNSVVVAGLTVVLTMAVGALGAYSLTPFAVAGPDAV